MKKSAKVALCGVLSALALVTMLLTVIPIATYCIPALAGILLMPIALEVGPKWGIAGYVASALLSILVTPDMEAKVLFIAFFGYYPTVKILFSSIPSKALRWCVKLLLFNVTMIGSYLLLLYVLGLPADSFELFDINLPWVFLAVGDGIFVLYDYALTGLVEMYKRRWHQLFVRVFK